jgi:hypothetical protein
VVHVVDLAMAASIAGRPLVARSETASAAQRTESNDVETRRAYNARSEEYPTILQTEASDRLTGSSWPHTSSLLYHHRAVQIRHGALVSSRQPPNIRSMPPLVDMAV